jgi:predicted GIY-YIG superfamily endonuclease
MGRNRSDDMPEDESGDEIGNGVTLADDVDLVDAADLAAVPERLKAGTEIIAGFVRNLPNAPGVYRMFDAAGDVLYVGKAKNLKKRVGQYAAGRAHTNAVARMIAETAQMEFVTTGTETEALLLESNLIKQLRPRYNVLLRDDKSFPYILLTGDHAAQGRLFRPVCLGLGGEAHHRRAAEGLSAALLFGQLLRQPHPPLPAVPDQALRGALHRRNLAGGLWQAHGRGARLPVGPRQWREAGTRPAHAASLRGHGIRDRRALP